MIRLRALGECAFDVGTERLGPEAELAFALLLVLVLADGRRLSRQRIVDLLWPGTSAERARHNLRQAVYKLRQLGVPLDTDPGHVRLAPQVVDAALVLPGADDQKPSPLLLKPDAPFGEFLAGYAPRFSASFATWVDEQRGIVHARLRRSLLTLLADERRRGSWGAVETLARKCLQIDPLNEEATMALAEATALTGSKRAAIALLDGYLQELGPGAVELRLPAAVLRRRIAERVTPAASFAAAPDCFVGREESIAWLREQLRPVLDGCGRPVLLWGEEGMGKSRLVAEFSRMAELDGVRTVRITSQPRDLERPLSAFMDLVPELQALPGALGCSPESFEYLRRLTDHDPAVVEPSAATREAELLYASVRRALFDLIDAVAGEAPLVLCLEDTHWLDDRSWRVTRELAGWVADRPVLLLLTSRSPHGPAVPPSRPLAALSSHRLPPLAQPAAMTLFNVVSGSSAPPTAFRDWAVHVAAGNPFMIRALAAHWAETGEVRAPTSLDVLVAERVARITGRPLRTLQACAVLGKYATVGRLEAVLQYPRHELLEAATELEDCGMVEADGPAVPCRHELIARAALGLLQDGTLRLLHRCAGEVLEREVRDARSAALLWDCAQQWQAAGEQARALGLVRSCAGYLLEVGLPTEAAEAYERALELCETDAERVEMLASLAQANQLCGRWLAVLKAVREHQSLSQAMPPVDEHSETELLELEAQWRTGEDLGPLLISAMECAGDDTALSNHRLRAGGLALIFADNLCDFECAHEVYTGLAERFSSATDEEVRQEALQLAMIYHASYGELSESVRLARLLTYRAPDSTNSADWIRLVSRASIPLRRAGYYAEACTLVRSVLSIAEQYQFASAAASAADILATMMLEQEKTAASRKWQSRAQYWTELQEGRAASESVSYLAAKIALREDRVNDAREILGAAADSLLSDPRIRMRNEALALHLDLQLREGSGPPSPSLSDVLSEGFHIAKQRGGQDYPCAILAETLSRLQRQSEARQLVDDYLTRDRRERSSVPSMLTRFLK